MIEIYAKTVSLKQMIVRYGCESAGDYWRPHPELINIRSLELGSPVYEFLVIGHEMDEEFLCTLHGIKETDVQAFDQMFEREREQGLHGKDDESGDDPRSPYYNEHQAATKMEKMRAEFLGVDWEEYGNAIIKAFNNEEST